MELRVNCCLLNNTIRSTYTPDENVTSIELVL